MFFYWYYTYYESCSNQIMSERSHIKICSAHTHISSQRMPPCLSLKSLANKQAVENILPNAYLRRSKWQNGYISAK